LGPRTSGPDSLRDPPQSPAIVSENVKLPDVNEKASTSWMSSGPALQRSSTSTPWSAETSGPVECPEKLPYRITTRVVPAGGDASQLSEPVHGGGSDRRPAGLSSVEGEDEGKGEDEGEGALEPQAAAMTMTAIIAAAKRDLPPDDRWPTTLLPSRSLPVWGNYHTALPRPFPVMAQENPTVAEGTCPPPEAQVDLAVLKFQLDDSPDPGARPRA
jgi:hypothetical protein